jgi:hypothetical protein
VCPTKEYILRDIKTRLLVLSLGVIASQLASSASAAPMALAPHLIPNQVEAAKQLGQQLDDSVWSFDCGQGKFTAGFDASGKIVLNATWAGYTWAVTGGRAMTMVSKEGEPIQFRFDQDVKTGKFISWGSDTCTVARIK